MALTPASQRYSFTDPKLNTVFQDYKNKINEVIEYFLDTDFGNLALYDTDQSDILNLKWNEDDSNPRDLNFKVNNANRTINLTGNLTVEAASVINSDLSTDANWSTSGSITAASLIIGANTLNTDEWAFLDGQDQALKTTDAPGFATGVTIGKLTLADGSITESDGAISFGNENLDTSGYIALKSNAELRFYDNGNYVGFEAPALSADCIWVLPTADGGANQVLYTDGSKNLAWGSYAGNVTATANFGTDNVLIRSDGTLKALQHSGITVDNSDNLSGVGIVTGGASLYLESAGGALEYVKSQTINDNTTAATTYVAILTTGIVDSLLRSTSGKKYKDKIKDLELDSSLIYELRPVSFNSKCKADDENKRWSGLVADEVGEILPEMVYYNKDNEAESYDNQMLTTLMLKEIQNLNKRIKSLEEG